MKNILRSIIYMSFAGLIVTSCAKNDDFTTPDLQECVKLETNTTIAKLESAANGTITQYQQDDILSGIVVSSDAGGSFFKELFVVSSDGQQSLRIRVDAYSTYASYGVGQEVYVKLKGLFTQKDPQRLITTIGGDDKLSAIKEASINKFVIRACNKYVGDDFDRTFNTKVSLEEALDDKYIGKLVTILDVQFKKEHRGKAFVESGDFAKVYIESKKPASKSVYFNVSKNAKGFAKEIVPSGSGSIVGVMTRYVGADKVVQYQFIPRTMHDLAGLDKDPFYGNEGGEEETLPQHEIKITGALAWLGADFKDFNAFMGTLEDFKGVKLKDYAGQAVGLGWEKSDALSIKGKPTANDFVFTVINNKVPADAEAITFLLKGKATGGKSISINVYNEDGTKYDTAFNLGVVGSDDISLNKAVIDENNKYLNNYNGSINTKGRWIKVTLNLKGVKYNTSGKDKFFAFKVGTGGDYDILLDEFRVVGGKDDGGTTGPEVPGQGLGNLVFFGSDFKNWADFDKASYDDKIKPDTTIFTKGTNNGKDGGNALIIDATPVNKNPYVFSAKNIAGKEVAKGKKKIVFYLKGKATKGMSINVYGPDEPSSPNQFGDKFSAFNLGEVTTSEITVSGNKGNSYSGSIDTQGKWVKVTLDLSTMGGSYYTEAEKPILSVKVGGNAGSSWQNVLISGFTFE